VPVELSSLVEQIYRRARASYGDGAGEMAPMRLYEDLIGTPLRRIVPIADAGLAPEAGLLPDADFPDAAVSDGAAEHPNAIAS
ncbi:MAG: hypothetical protein ACTH31_05250, partial [Pseudoclavibacter sp.]